MFVARQARAASHLRRPAPVEFTRAHPVTFERARIQECLLPRPDGFGTLLFKLRCARA